MAISDFIRLRKLGYAKIHKKRKVSSFNGIKNERKKDKYKMLPFAVLIKFPSSLRPDKSQSLIFFCKQNSRID